MKRFNILSVASLVFLKRDSHTPEQEESPTPPPRKGGGAGTRPVSAT